MPRPEDESRSRGSDIIQTAKVDLERTLVVNLLRQLNLYLSVPIDRDTIDPWRIALALSEEMVPKDLDQDGYPTLPRWGEFPVVIIRVPTGQQPPKTVEIFVRPQRLVDINNEAWLLHLGTEKEATHYTVSFTEVLMSFPESMASNVSQIPPDIPGASITISLNGGDDVRAQIAGIRKEEVSVFIAKLTEALAPE